MFQLECAKYWEDSMQTGEFIIHTVIYKALNQTGDILFIQWVWKAGVYHATSFIRRFF